MTCLKHSTTLCWWTTYRSSQGWISIERHSSYLKECLQIKRTGKTFYLLSCHSVPRGPVVDDGDTVVIPFLFIKLQCTLPSLHSVGICIISIMFVNNPSTRGSLNKPPVVSEYLQPPNLFESHGYQESDVMFYHYERWILSCWSFSCQSGSLG